MNNAKKILLKITTQKISEKESLKLYSDLTTPDIDALEKSKSKSKDRRHNILNFLKTLKSLFTGAYLYYKKVSKETMFERSIAERTKLRRERLDKIKRKEQSITMNCLKNTLLIIKAQVICTKNQARKKVQ